MDNIKTMQEQMDLFENGGLKDDGMTKDPISNNPIPTGSMANEVRDDIPAMLSEGEYVVPADVLRYYGVNFFENLRNQAKNNLTQMERTGRIGGEPLTPEQAQRNMQIKPIGMPKPQGVNEGGVMQGFNTGSLASPFSTMSSSYYQNLTPEQRAKELSNIPEGQLSFMRPHYNKEGEIRMVEYVGTTAENATIKSGQEELLRLYPLTEEQYNALVSASKDDRDDGPDLDPDNNPKGSDTSWADGIDWSDDAAVKAWAMESVKVSSGQAIAGKIPIIGPIAGAMATGSYANELNNVMGVAGIMEDQGRSKLSEFLKNTVTEAITTGENAKNPLLQGIYALGGIGGNRPRGNEDLISKILGSKTSVAIPTSIKSQTNTSQLKTVTPTKTDKDKVKKDYSIFSDDKQSANALVAQQQAQQQVLDKNYGVAEQVADRQTSIDYGDKEEDLITQINKGGLMRKKKTKGK
tara:strand:+ start:982 stop:2373 length:1392 start_codon:yes stop_codon:yes gene_type:complete